MASNFEDERAIETYKSLVQISLAGLKLLALLNGGAAVALLAYLGNIAGKGMSAPDVQFPMGCYLVGLVLCGLAFLASYLTQLRLYNESVGGRGSGAGRHELWLYLAIILAFLSLAAFAFGSYSSAQRLRIDHAESSASLGI